VSYRR